MSRYLLYYTGAEQAPTRDVSRLRSDPQADVVAASKDMVLVEADDQGSIDRVLAGLPGWSVSADNSIEFPVETGLTRASRG
jgi:hypothetical protein